MNRKKILFISSWYPTRINPTNGDFVQRHAQAISQLHDLVALHIVYDENLAEKRELSISANNGYDEYILYFNVCKPLRVFKSLVYFFLYVSMYKTITRKFGKPDLIHANIIHPIGIIALLFKIFYKIPYVFTEHWSGYSSVSSIKLSKFKLFYIKLVAKHAKCIMPVSLLLQESMQKLGIHGNYAVINNVVDTSLFKPIQKENHTLHRILHVSTLNEEFKNVFGILRSIEQLSKIRQDFVLEIVSENSGKELMEYAKKLSIEKYISFLGYKNRLDLASLMPQSAFFLLFSNYETFSCVIIEAFASGIPVISTNSVGVVNHITPDKGFVVNTGDEQNLVGKMNVLLDSYMNYNAQNLHNYANDNFSYISVAKSIDVIYNS